MLEIKMTSGDVLVHGDQQPDAIAIKGYDGSKILVHAGEWGRHKYIRKEGNRYIYPEDLQKTAKNVKKSDSGVITPTNPNLGNNSSSRFVGKGALLYAIKNLADDAKEKNKKKKAEQEAISNASHMTESEKKKRANALASEIKNDPLYTAIQDKKRKKIEEDRPKSRKKKVVAGGKEIKKGDSVKERAAEKERQKQHEANMEIQRKKTAERKEAKRQAQMREEQQIRDAHKTDTTRPSGSHTSANLEKQKRKTAARRQAKYISDTSSQVSYNHQGYSDGAGNSSTPKLEEMKAKKRAKDIKKYGYSEYTRRRTRQNAYK